MWCQSINYKLKFKRMKLTAVKCYISEDNHVGLIVLVWTILFLLFALFMCPHYSTLYHGPCNIHVTIPLNYTSLCQSQFSPKSQPVFHFQWG
jgi:hypothetical protein